MISRLEKVEDSAQIWKNSAQYPNLKAHACKVLSYFSSTYCCESSFSNLKKIKDPTRSRLRDEQLEDQMILMKSKIVPDLQSLAKKKHE